MQSTFTELGSSQPSVIPDSTPIQRACFVTAVVAIVGWALASGLSSAGLDRTNGASGNVFYYLFCANEPINLLVLILASLFCLLWFRFDLFSSRNTVWPEDGQFRWGPILVAAIGVLLITSAGTRWVFHSFPLSMDEYMADFQARIFAAGKMKSTIPLPWREFAYALTPIFATYDPQEHTWIAGYLPVYAAMRAGLAVAGIDSMTNPILAAVSIVAIAGVSRQLWPDTSENWVSILMLATSAQFLITSMTGYSMPAHLCLNLIWLWLYVRADRVSLLLIPWVGVLALGLHNPVVHSLFATPFLIRLAKQKRFAILSYFGVVYLIGLVLFAGWLQLSRRGAMSWLGGAPSTADFFGIPGLLQVINQTASLVLLVSWESLAMAALVFMALRNWKALPPLMRDLAGGCLLTFVFYFFFKVTQGHGWGYRYFHGVLGNLALLSGIGWRQLSQLAGPTKARQFLFASICLVLLVQLPLRCVQAEKFVRPFARSMDYLRSIPASCVVLDYRSAWYAQDLVRNAPFLEGRPKLLFSHRLSSAQIERLRATGGIHVVEPQVLSQLGMHLTQGPRK